jgi:hypothetical protein
MEDKHTGEIMTFDVNRWLSADDGQLIRELPVHREGQQISPGMGTSEQCTQFVFGYGSLQLSRT